MKNLVKDASMGPLREALRQGIEITNLKKEDMRPVTFQVKITAHSASVLFFIFFLHHNNYNLFLFYLI